MKVVTWNLNQSMSHERAGATADWLVQQDADVLLLQELTCGRHEVFEDALAATHNFAYARHRGAASLHGVAIAVRKSLGGEAIERFDVPGCETFVAGWTAPSLGLVLNAHIPNGTTWGWDKMKVWQRIHERVLATAGPLIVGGDFNAPALEPHEHAGDRTLCFGYLYRDASGRARGMSPTVVAELRELGNVALPEEYWPEWDPEKAPMGTTRDGKAWEAIESWIFNARDEHGLIDAYRQAPGNLEQRAHSHIAGHKIPMRYDHLFVRGYTPMSARYHPELLGSNVTEGSKLYSDHAPLVAEVEPEAH